MDINNVLETSFVKTLIHEVCGDEIQLVSRGNSFAVRRRQEDDRDIYRVILLPPRGFTANAIEQMNSHDEADFATIQIKGAVKKGKSGFSKLKDCLLVASKDENGAVSELTHPYLTFDGRGNSDPDLTLKRHSSGTAPFPVVKNNGFGFYHNLINLTDDWLVLKLHKRLRPQKVVNLEPVLQGLEKQHANVLRIFYQSIVKYGDDIFSKSPTIVRAVLELPIDKSLPALGEMLYVHDSGMHEACTVFGVILKMGNQCPDPVIDFLTKAHKERLVPPYYAEQLIGKIYSKLRSGVTVANSRAA